MKQSNPFASIVRKYKKQHNIMVRKWRKTLSGCAWAITHADGKVVNWIESPYPKSLVSFAIFLHEIGHHVIGFKKYKKRCEEEYFAWRWAIDEMRRIDIRPDEIVLERFNHAMQIAVDVSLKRGLKELPQFLKCFAANSLMPHAT